MIVVAGGSDPKPPAPLQGAAQVDSLLAGITQSRNRLGSPSAPVTMVEYVDLQCPICRDFEENYFPEIVERYVRSGKVQVESRPLAFIGSDSQNGQFGAIAAGDQDRMFHLMQILYQNQGPENSGWLSENMVESAAVSFGLDLDRFRTAFDSADTKSLADSYASGRRRTRSPVHRRFSLGRRALR